MAKLSTIIIAKAQLKAVQALTYILPVSHPLVFAGPNSALNLCDNIQQLDMKKVLIVTDEVLLKLGVIQPLQSKLEQANIQVTIFSEVKPDPTFEVVEKAIQLFTSSQSDSVLAVGGGSTIDTSKVLALAAANNKSPKQLIGILKARKPSFPLFVIPTTAGTGSEVTVAAVLSDNETHVKSLVIDHKVVPLATALDPVIMQGMPPTITADTGIDALTHALESWVSEFANQETDFYSRAATKIILDNLVTAWKDGKNLAAREAMALGSHYAGLAMNKAAIGYVHALAHQLGAKYGIPHGRANAIILPYVLEFNREASEKRLAKLAREIGLTNAKNDSEATDIFIQRIKTLLVELNINTQVQGIQQHDFPDMIEAAFTEEHGMNSIPKYKDYADAERIKKKKKKGSS